MDTRKIREEMGGITVREFSEKTGIPQRTVENWDLRKQMKEWLWKYIYKKEVLEKGYKGVDNDTE